MFVKKEGKIPASVNRPKTEVTCWTEVIRSLRDSASFQSDRIVTHLRLAKRQERQFGSVQIFVRESAEVTISEHRGRRGENLLNH